MKVSELISRLQQQSGDMEVEIFLGDMLAKHVPVQGVGTWSPDNGATTKVEVLGFANPA
jgi:hypothetical protein